MIATDLNESLQSSTFVLADFWTPGCGFCHLMEPAVNEIGRIYQDLAVVKVNLREHSVAGEVFKIKAVPTFILFKDSKELNRLEGNLPFHILDNFVKEQISGDLVCAS